VGSAISRSAPARACLCSHWPLGPAPASLPHELVNQRLGQMGPHCRLCLPRLSHLHNKPWRTSRVCTSHQETFAPSSGLGRTQQTPATAVGVRLLQIRVLLGAMESLVYIRARHRNTSPLHPAVVICAQREKKKGAMSAVVRASTSTGGENKLLGRGLFGWCPGVRWLVDGRDSARRSPLLVTDLGQAVDGAHVVQCTGKPPLSCSLLYPLHVSTC
jgi:hypothetical protein